MATQLEKHRATTMHDKYLVKFGRAVFELCEQTDRQTDRQTDEQTDILITMLRDYVLPSLQLLSAQKLCQLSSYYRFSSVFSCLMFYISYIATMIW